MITIDVVVVDTAIAVIEINGFHASTVRRVISMFAEVLTGRAIVIRVVALCVIVASMFQHLMLLLMVLHRLFRLMH